MWGRRWAWSRSWRSCERRSGCTRRVQADRAGVQAPGDQRPDVLSVADQVRGVEEDEAQRLEAIEQENARLKKIVAEQALDISMLRDLERGKW